MALFDRYRRSKNSVNEPLSGMVTLTPFNLGSKRFADAYVVMLLSRIFRGMRNVNFTVDEHFTHDTDGVRKIADFLNSTAQEDIWTLWNNGAIVIERRPDGTYETVPAKLWKRDPQNSQRIVNYKLVTYSDAYRFTGRTDIDVLRDHIVRLDRLVNADDYLTQSLGAFGILSGSSMGLTPEDKKTFLEGIKKNIGITRDKFQFMLMGSPVDFKQVELPIDKLKLSDKVKEEVMAIAGYFGIPYDLVPLSGKSTYANQAAAVVDFYRNCISPLAEVLLELGRYAIRCDNTIPLPSRALTFTLDNIPELEADKDDRDKRIERATKAAELIEKLKNIEGADITPYLDIING